MNVLIILCGHTVGVITSILAEQEEKQWVADSGPGGWTQTFCSQLALKWVNAEYFWTSDWLNLFYVLAYCLRIGPELGWKSVCVYKNFILFYFFFLQINKQSLCQSQSCFFLKKTWWKNTFSLLLMQHSVFPVSLVRQWWNGRLCD